MDALTAAAFESRASEAEARLTMLEAKLLAGGARCRRQVRIEAAAYALILLFTVSMRPCRHALRLPATEPACIPCYVPCVGAASSHNVDELMALRDLLVKAREETVKLQAERDAVSGHKLWNHPSHVCMHIALYY